MTRAAAAAAAALLLAACAAVPGGGPALASPLAPLLSGYKDVTLGFDRQQHRIALPPASAPGIVSLAFASGECGSEHWAGIDAARLAAVNLPRLQVAGLRWIVSTGGQAGVFTCNSDDGMRRFVARYAGPGLVGFDFDIEGSQTQAQIDDLVRHAAAAARRDPALTFSFTLATHAGRGGEGLNATGRAVMAALARHRFDTAVVNLMVMDYGPASDAHCVVVDGRCDMAASALQAARNLERSHGVPPRRIALTPMLGVNDVVDNVYTVADAERVAAAVREGGYAALHYWSIDRDRPCPGQAVRSDCSSLADPSGAYARAHARGLAAPR